MDQEILVDSYIDIGRRAVEAFDESGPKAPGVFWLYYPDATEWRLVVVTSLVDSEGPKAAYSKIADTLNAHNLAERLPLRKIAAMGTKDRLVKLLQTGIPTGPGIHGIWFLQNVIDGNMIDDAYIYRMLKPQKRRKAATK